METISMDMNVAHIVTELTNEKAHPFKGWDDSEFGVRHLLARCRKPTSINFLLSIYLCRNCERMVYIV